MTEIEIQKVAARLRECEKNERKALDEIEKTGLNENGFGTRTREQWIASVKAVLTKWGVMENSMFKQWCDENNIPPEQREGAREVWNAAVNACETALKDDKRLAAVLSLKRVKAKFEYAEETKGGG